MNRLELRYTPVQPDWSDETMHGVTPYIDGVSLIDLVEATGAPVPGPLTTWAYPALARGAGLIEVLDCSCTVHDCGGLDARVERTDATVTWAAFLDPNGDEVPVGAFEFNAAQYDAEVTRIDVELHRMVPAEAYLRAFAFRGLNLAGVDRVLIGVAGSPGAGKTTAATGLAASMNEIVSTAVLSMDGFHLPQAELVRRGRRDRMGAPDTFDVDGFVALLEALRAGGEVAAPGFDRTTEEPVPRAIVIGADIRVVIVEGNYLLHDHDGWKRVRPLLDRVVFLAPDDTVRRDRLIARHVAFGKSPEAAEAWVARSDDPNAALVAAIASRADEVITSLG